MAKNGPSYRNTRALTALRETMRASRAMINWSAEVVSDSGLSESEFDAVMTLGNNHDGMRMKDIADHMLTTAPNVTRVLKALERKGFASREVNPESDRERIAKLTPQGEHLFREFYPAAYKKNKQELDRCLDEQQQDLLIELLLKID